MSFAESVLVDWRRPVRELPDPHRFLALVSLAVLSIIYLSKLHAAAGVVGAENRFIVVASGTIFLAFVLSRWLDVRAAIGLGGAVIVLGIGYYVGAVSGGIAEISDLGGLLYDSLALASGITILSIVRLDIWVLVVLPAPLFLSWYLSLRERYVMASAAGLAMLTFLMATGDVGSIDAAVGVIGAAGIVAFGELHRREARVAEADLLAVLFAVMLVASLSVSVIPGGAQPLDPIGGAGGGGGAASTDSALIGGTEMSVSGSPSLDPSVRFTIEAEEAQNWRVDAYDRYTGDGWIQTGEPEPFVGSEPPSNGDRLQIGIEPEIDGANIVPALWRPVAIEGIDGPLVTPGGGIQHADGVDTSERYEIISERPVPRPEEISEGERPPEDIRERYTQLPDSTPDRVGDFTAELIEDDASPYEAAMTIEQYIIQTNEYSLDVSAPDGDIADEQIFERDAGYCSFFATTMAVMLRTQDIPARVVTGYSSGQRVAEDRWVVRGMNAHAWVEVYIPDVGWVEFDPTPSDPYDSARDERLEEARQEDEENVDTDESVNGEWEPDPEDDNVTADDSSAGADNESNQSDLEPLREFCENPQAIVDGDLTEQEARGLCSFEQLEEMEGVEPTELDFATPGVVTTIDPSEFRDQGTPEERSPTLPPADQIVLAVAALIAGVAGGHRAGLTGRARRAFVTRWQGRTADPDGAVERAWRRLEAHLEGIADGRSTGESARAYVQRLEETHDIDPAVYTVVHSYERARYSPHPVSPESATNAVETVDAIVGRRIPGSPDIDD